MEQLPDFEKLGVFYLGREYDVVKRQPTDGLLLYKSKDLTTHAVCVGMTGSGKTGLCIDLLEEAAIDGIPAIVIDPKGDMPNLMLTFPELGPDDFLPWVNEDDARRKGLSTTEFAKTQSELWTNGLAKWGQDGARIRRLRESTDCVVYTPGSTAGVPVSVLKSFEAPAQAVIDDAELLGDRVGTTVTSLLALMGIMADPVRSREHILLSHLLMRSWQEGQTMDMSSLIQQIQSPPMEHIGVMNLESFFPAKDRFSLAIALNNLLAAPGFRQWQEGQPLDIGSMLYTPAGKPRMAIVSIAHLSEAERMFFVSLLLNEIVGWVRSQSGTTSLRAILYMDEIYGFFPPVENPPSKKPLLTLLKQARAHGLGVVLSTQNPVDLDYKGLANTGTWFIGRLQTERDKARVIQGLEGASTAAGTGFSRPNTERLISGLGSRIFLLHNVHQEATQVFESRWAMSYLRGPMTRTQIKRLTSELRAQQPLERVVDSRSPLSHTTFSRSAESTGVVRPVLPPSVPEYFAPVRGLPKAAKLWYQPVILAAAQLVFVDRRSGVQLERDLTSIVEPIDGPLSVDWSRSVLLDLPVEEMEKEPIPGALFAAVPPAASSARNYVAWKREATTWMYRSQTAEVLYSPKMKQVSKPGESERDFRLRVVQFGREKRDEETERLREKYDKRMSSLQDRILKAEQAVEREQDQEKQQKMQTAISLGAGLLGSFLGGGRSSIGRMTTAARGASRSRKEKQDIERAKESLEALKEKLAQLEADFGSDKEQLAAEFDSTNEPFERKSIRPLKKDIHVQLLALCWLPFWQDSADAVRTPAY
ncbi:MAG: ATP-binding protein [Dehalococcoidia bacterium]|nr:ATP-binding protein [Dehalococcoidia bacterium]